jgi:hypothetical protein
MAHKRSDDMKLSAENARLKYVWDELDEQERALKLEQKHLSEVWIRVCEKHKENEKARNEIEEAKKANGLIFVHPSVPIRLNVGGQLFETSAGVLCRDEFSVLAGLCRGNGSTLDPRLAPDEFGASEGYFFIDRDWWVFRHILQFLRTGELPEDAALIEELYSEATFYRLSLLRQAIEKQRAAYHERQRSAATRAPSAALLTGSHRGCACGTSCGGRCGVDGGGRAFEEDFRRSARHSFTRSHELPDPFGFAARR